ncbi:MAG: dihydroorotate dehydrogenase electron transfer subunit [Candidatus Hodarchaeota archaeon]
MAASSLYPRIVAIESIEEYSANIKGFFFEEEFLAKMASPGQFAMLWIPGVDEIPLAFARIDHVTRIIGFIVQRVGTGTQRLFQLKKGDRVGIRGPFGNGFDLALWERREVFIVGGGVAMAPLMPLVSFEGAQKSLDIFYGAKNQDSLAIDELTDRQKLASSQLHIATEDGSVGEQGTVVDLVRSQLSNSRNKSPLILAAGPERMLLALHTLLLEKVPKGNWEFSLCDRYMKCGFGICGSCSLDELGLRLCVEGPVLGRRVLSQLKSFGNYGRDACGQKEYFK